MVNILRNANSTDFHTFHAFKTANAIFVHTHVYTSCERCMLSIHYHMTIHDLEHVEASATAVSTPCHFRYPGMTYITDPDVDMILSGQVFSSRSCKQKYVDQ